MTLKLATWNINSVRLRLEHVKTLHDEEQPDIICLQETKTPNEKFPLEAIQSFGYPHVAFNGEKGYNGVAILSRRPLSNITILNFTDIVQARHISAQLPDGTEIHNVYVPAGGDEPDPEINPKFDHKLRFVDDMSRWFSENRSSEDKIIIVGDMNIAPLENDVWSHKQLLKVVSHTPIEVKKFAALQASLSWIDVLRHFVPLDEKLYSWWSYRNKDWRKSNRGRRLDHVWVTPALQPALQLGDMLPDVRDWVSPSDHVPVVIELSL